MKVESKGKCTKRNITGEKKKKDEKLVKNVLSKLSREKTGDKLERWGTKISGT